MATRDGEQDHGVLTQKGSILGTPSYMSPEQIQSCHDIDGRTDLWSVGAMLYEMITGSRPFRGDDLRTLLFAVMTAPIVPPMPSNTRKPGAR